MSLDRSNHVMAIPSRAFIMLVQRGRLHGFGNYLYVETKHAIMTTATEKPREKRKRGTPRRNTHMKLTAGK